MPITLFLVPFLQALYGFLLGVAGALWSVDRSLLLAGLLIQQVTAWLANGLFSPVISQVAGLSQGLMPIVLTIAMFALGLGYLLAPFAHVRVVNPGRAAAWLLFALIFYQAGPQLYLQGEQARRAISATLYQQVLTKTGSQSLSGLASSPPPGQPSMGALANQFGGYAPDDQYVDGLDVAMAYVFASGSDVVQPSSSLPQAYSDTYFPLATSLVNFMTMSWLTLVNALNLPLDGVFRMATAPPLIIFGILEQLIYFALTVAVGLLFISMAVAILFSLFQATEPMAKTILDMWLELFILSIVISVAQAIIVGLVIAAATSANPAMALGSSVIGLLMMGGLAMRAFGSIWDALGRFTNALGAVTHGKVQHVGELGFSVGTAALGTAVTLATAGVGAGVAAAAGGTLAQVAGSALAGSDNLFSAAAIGSMVLPDESPLKKTATGFYEGSMSQRLMGPAGGLMMGHSPEPAPALPATGADTNALRQAIEQAMTVAVTIAPHDGYSDSQVVASAIRDALGNNPAAQAFFNKHEETIVSNVIQQSTPLQPPATTPSNPAQS